MSYSTTPNKNICIEDTSIFLTLKQDLPHGNVIRIFVLSCHILFIINVVILNFTLINIITINNNNNNNNNNSAV